MLVGALEEPATEAFLEAEFTKTGERLRLRGLETDEWRPHIRFSGHTRYLTAEETGEVLAEIGAIFERTAERMRKPETRPDGATGAVLPRDHGAAEERLSRTRSPAVRPTCGHVVLPE